MLLRRTGCQLGNVFKNLRSLRRLRPGRRTEFTSRAMSRRADSARGIQTWQGSILTCVTQKEVAMLFHDRSDAGRRLGSQLKKFAGQDVVVLALPRGGVPVGYEVPQALHAPLDVLVVRKLGAPGQEELAVGAVATGDVCVWNWEAIDALHISLPQMDLLIEKGVRELEERERRYRGGRERF